MRRDGAVARPRFDARAIPQQNDAMRGWLWRIAAFVWGVAEATLFFIVPDVILSYLGLKRGARDTAIASLCAAAGAAVGGIIMFTWSQRDPAGAYAAVLAVPAISAAMGDAAFVAMQTKGWFVATLEGPLSRTPYKVYAVIAPHMSAPLWLFAAASVLARLPRFLIVALGTVAIRHWLKRRFDTRRLVWVWAIAWVVFYIGFFALTPS